MLAFMGWASQARAEARSLPRRAGALLVTGALLTGAAGAAAASPPGRVQRVVHRRSEMAVVPAGTFLMGFPDSEKERDDLMAACEREFGRMLAERLCDERRWRDALPAREVYLPLYEIDRHEVTVAQYRRCVAAGGCDIAALLAGDGRYIRDGWPMVNVTWQDASDYCLWAGKRLPTEAEWEKAARGTDGRRWPWGNQERVDGSNHGAVEREAITLTHGMVNLPLLTPTQEFVADASDGFELVVAPGRLQWSEGPYGTFDMAGNVAEWVADYYVEAGYEGLPLLAPLRDTPEEGYDVRVYRGGSWAQPRLFGRTYYRNSDRPQARAFDRGFRCVRDP
jgi:formylglycine-generating enzyme required for sulfatase activity